MLYAQLINVWDLVFQPTGFSKLLQVLELLIQCWHFSIMSRVWTIYLKLSHSCLSGCSLMMEQEIHLTSIEWIFIILQSLFQVPVSILSRLKFIVVYNNGILFLSQTPTARLANIRFSDLYWKTAYPSLTLLNATLQQFYPTTNLGWYVYAKILKPWECTTSSL